MCCGSAGAGQMMGAFALRHMMDSQQAHAMIVLVV
jgi:hypothetical protein